MDDWPTGPVAVVMPPLTDHLTNPHVLELYEKRLQANLDGRCPECGVTVTLPNRHARRKAKALGLPAPSLTMIHASWCPVGDENMLRAVRAGQN